MLRVLVGSALCCWLAVSAAGCDSASGQPAQNQPPTHAGLGGGGAGAPLPNGGPPPPGAGSPAAGSFYDPTPLLVSVRPGQRADLATRAGIRNLDELPLYDLDLDVDVDKATFELKEKVFFTNRESKPLDEVVLRIYGNSTEGGTATSGGPLVAFGSGSCVGQTCEVKSEGPSTISVKPAKTLAPGDRLVIEMKMSGRLEEIDASRTNLLAQSIESLPMLGGAESHGYGLLAKGDGIASLASFYAVVARRRDGAWERTDESTMGDLGSDDMSHVRARIEVDDKVRVATTGVTTKEDSAGGKRTFEVKAAMVREFAVVASDQYETATATVGDVTIRSHFLPKERAAGERVLDVAKESLAIYEKRFGAYPYADLDLCEAALIGGAGGVEFAGMTTLASMLYRPAFPTDGLLGTLLGGLTGLSGAGGGGPDPMTELTNKMLEFTTAHEVAHQYWHGLVGSDSRNHPYLDEGLAQFSTMQYLEDRYGKTRAKQDGDMNVAMNYRAMRMLGQQDAPVDQPAAKFSGMLSYAGLVYGKGPYLWIALRDEVGAEAFFKSVQRYVTDNGLKIAKPRALIETLAADNPAKATRIRELAQRWLEGNHGDEDIGGGNLFEMIAPMIGIDPSTIDPAMMKMFEQLLDPKGGGGPGMTDLLDLLMQGS